MRARTPQSWKETLMGDIRRPSAARAIALAVASLALVPVLAGHTAQQAAPTSLRSVMQGMGRDMHDVAGAISVEDWAEVAELALNVSHHAEPPASEKVPILAWLRADAAKFRMFDKQVRTSANAMGEAATRGDGPAAISAFADLQQGCLGCHQRFRKAFVEKFREQH